MWIANFVFSLVRYLLGFHVKLLCEHEDPLRCHTCSYDGHGDVTRSLSEKTGIPTARYDAVNLHITNQGAPWQFRRFRSIDYSQYFPKMITINKNSIVSGRIQSKNQVYSLLAELSPFEALWDEMLTNEDSSCDYTGCYDPCLKRTGKPTSCSYCGSDCD